MSKKRKLLEKVLSGSKNLQFDDLVTLVEAFGFSLSRINSSHHIFTHPTIPELINLKNRNSKAIPDQIRQFLILIEKYSLTMENE
ncbi:type II toxin-antitoxin system HicA family toxin [Dolichospermum circinale CS-1225]|uniref:type II toxin-antitoxin system HicA family toxin n=1 Tax=Dolichospermum circinale TaxID=109265 RepID=UPI00232FA734|nr:type II toxin-antitoxin system HicA family toxin [Dolichospermum circinale]MDB9460615.1 type II toxin-antitoxin system HicA family toxin [Dolichospermum circinale CS-545/17]MDB9466847.1 type II toxin-antitoxin system HicA family toxin [Dolichospermum circinale CS-539/09]MDB9471880.1 type II toxin-antitoxin system HicA family toxin [Dolichospermum circinale CS-539]MDB9521493.1 type II toxin-antitoxin system HicA family toxin [Dolichospermum circinale CS-1225]